MLLPRELDHSAPPSPGGFEFFGLVGWAPPPQGVVGITFFIDGTAMVTDQHGRPIRGVVKPGSTPIYFAMQPPKQDNQNPGYRESINEQGKKTLVKLATHLEVVRALEGEGIDWRGLTSAGWPQIPYADLKKLKALPPIPFQKDHDPNPQNGAPCTCVACSIKDPVIRKDAIRIHAEINAARAKEVADVEAAVAEAEE